MVINLNEKAGFHFCQGIILFRLRQKVVPYTKDKIYCRRNYEYFYQKLSRPQKKGKRPPGWRPLL